MIISIFQKEYGNIFKKKLRFVKNVRFNRNFFVLLPKINKENESISFIFLGKYPSGSKEFNNYQPYFLVGKRLFAEFDGY